MDGLLKWLVAAACLVIILGGSYYGWTEYRTAQELKAARMIASQRAAAQQAERERLTRLSPEACMQMAKETLPDRPGEPPKTSAHNKSLWECDDLGRFDASWRQALDRAGIF